MAHISATVEPTTVIETRDNPSERWGHIPVITFDDVNVYLGGLTTPEDADAKIIASADLLIDKLVGLRDAAAGRIASAALAALDAAVEAHSFDLAAIDAASPAQGRIPVAEWTRPKATVA